MKSGILWIEAALWVGNREVPANICTMDDDKAVIAMIDSNLQREKILSGEKVFVYKIRLQAMNNLPGWWGKCNPDQALYSSDKIDTEDFDMFARELLTIRSAVEISWMYMLHFLRSGQYA